MTFSVAWLSPFSRESDIGSFSYNLLQEFARPEIMRDMAVTLFVNPNGPAFWTVLPTVALTGDDQDREILAGFDLVVFNIGNNQENHGHINRLAMQVPGVIIVHDLIMQHYLAFEIFERLRRKDVYARLIADYYGAAGLDVLGLSQICSEVAAAVYSPWDSRHAAQMPLHEPFLHTAAAVVVHSAFGEAALRRSADLPLLRLQLPWDQKPGVSDAALQGWAARTAASGICSVVCFGHISRNKCLDRVVQAFGLSDALRRGARLTIAGYPGDRQYAAELEQQVRQLGLSHVASFAFGVSPAELAALKDAADVFVNLRHPNTETASGSLVEQMNTGRPVVIFPTGSYAEVPEAAAVRVDLADGVDGLRGALEALIADPQRRIAVGAAGRRHARRIGRAEYAQALLRFLSEHMTLLRARKLCSVGRRLTAPALTRAAVGSDWLDRLVATRELFQAIEAPRHQLDIVPFRDWEAEALLRYVALGLFGQLPDSALEASLRRVLRRAGRLALYRAVAEAHLLWCLGRMTPAESEPLRAVLLARPILSLPVYRLLAEADALALARGLYLGLLGRVGMTAELDQMSRRAASEPLERLVRDTLRSEEFRARHGAVAAAALALECDNLVPADTVYPPLPSGVVAFGVASAELKRHLFAGWHHLEDVGVWSRAATAVLLFSLPSPATGEPVAPAALSLSVRFPAFRALGPRDFRLRVNGGPAASFRFIRDDWMTCLLPLPPLCPGEDGYAIEFDAGGVVNLARQGIGKDTRDLGIRLRSVELVADRAELPPEPAAPVASAAWIVEMMRPVS